MDEIIPRGDKVSEEEANTLEGGGVQLLWKLGLIIHSHVNCRVKHDLVGLGIQFRSDVINTVHGEC